MTPGGPVPDPAGGRATAIADTHVHIRATVPAGAALGAAVRNFDAAESAMGRPADVGILFLARDTAEDPAATFALTDRTAGDWALRPGEGPDCAYASGPHRELVLVDGWQVNTRHGLEILALGCSVRPPEDPESRDLDATVNWALAHARLVVLPWGVGKWFGRRGRVVRAILESRPDVLLADNGSRPAWWPTPPLIERARAAGRPVLNGSDPLPLDGEHQRTGSAGVLTDFRFDPDRPVESFCSALRGGGADVQAYARAGGVGHFIRTQFAMQRRRWDG